MSRLTIPTLNSLTTQYRINPSSINIYFSLQLDTVSSVTSRNREASCRRNETSVSQMRLKPEPYVLRKDYLLTVWHSYHASRSLAIHIHMPQLLFSAGAGRCLARLIDYFVRKVGAPFTNISISIQVLQRIKCACVCVCLWKRKEGMFWC